MRNTALRISAAGLLMATAALQASAQAGSISVLSTANLSKAGTNAGSGDGVAPVAIALTAGTNRVLQVATRTSWGCQYGADFSADGFNSGGGICVGPANINAVGNISGYATPNRSMTLSALFLGAALPAAAPSNYDYTGVGAYNLATYSGIVNGQIFFVGDGLTGDRNQGGPSSGDTQFFLVPDDAEFLYFGVADGCAFVGNPDCYYDNVGTANLEYNVQGPEVSVVPEPSTYTLMFAGLLGVGALVRRRRSRTTNESVNFRTTNVVM